MKRIIRLFTIIGLFAFAFSNTMMAQPLPLAPPSPGGDPGGPPVGAPIGDSVLPLVLFALAYAAIKVYGIHKLQKAA
jgi:hypothetical protein